MPVSRFQPAKEAAAESYCYVPQRDWHLSRAADHKSRAEEPELGGHRDGLCHSGWQPQCNHAGM